MNPTKAVSSRVYHHSEGRHCDAFIYMGKKAKSGVLKSSEQQSNWEVGQEDTQEQLSKRKEHWRGYHNGAETRKKQCGTSFWSSSVQKESLYSGVEKLSYSGFVRLLRFIQASVPTAVIPCQTITSAVQLGMLIKEVGSSLTPHLLLSLP